MSECNEVADSLRERFRAAGGSTMADARAFLRGEMPGESVTVIDNVAWSLVAEPRAMPVLDPCAELRAQNDALVRGCQAALAYLADPPSEFPQNRRAAVAIIREALKRAGR